MAGTDDDLLANLAALERAVATTRTVKDFLDDTWFRSVEAAIRNPDESRAAPADPSGFLYDFCHPLRDVKWFEEAQRLALAGEVDGVSEDARFALWLAGVDPLRTVLPTLDERLTAVKELPFRRDVVAVKLAQLVAARLTPSLKSHLFELSVLGDLAIRGALVDVEEPATAVDGVARLDARDILVEATNTIQQLISDFVGVFSVDPNVEVDQVVYKLKKKVAHSRQLALANGRPTVLFLARTHLGAGRQAAHVALNECFAAGDFAALSGVVLSDSWKLYRTSWHPGIRPDVPLTEAESRAFASWYGQ